MKATSLLLIAGSALLMSSAPLYAGPIFFENFDELTPASAVMSAGEFSTGSSGTNVDIVGDKNGSFFPSLCAGPESGNCIDLGGSNGNPMGQLQSSPIMLGQGTYDLSFDLIGSQRVGYGTTSTSVTLGTVGNPGQLYNSGTLFNGLAYYDVTTGIINATFSVGSTETVYLDFDLTASGNPNVGSLLDNVSITETPEPSGLLLLGTGFVALAGFARRKIAGRVL
jgi:hypothetical protein